MDESDKIPIPRPFGKPNSLPIVDYSQRIRLKPLTKLILG
jgi:hypothetical protein